MEAAAGRSGSLPVPSPSSSQPLRKEWRAVSEHSFRNNGNEDPEHAKLGQSDERTIYEVQEGTGPLDVDFCSVSIDGSGGLSDELLQQRLQEISRQREELQQVEIDLKAEVIARTEILEVQNSFQSQIKEHADTTSKLKEELQEKEQHIHELEMKLEEKERELRVIRIDSEAAWAKEDLLREQNKELATVRRERDNSEAERAQHLKRIHELQEHIQEKESQFLALEDQHRVAQDAILYKDEQLREAQTWIARVQEMDALQSTTNQSLQAELRERTEQFNQYWIGLQRQFAEVERHHLQTIQQLQLELAEAREQNGIYKDGQHVARENSVDSSSYAQNAGNQINVNNGAASNISLGLISNGNMDGHPSYVVSSNASTKTEHAAGLTVVPPPMLGMGAFLPPGQMPALHPFVMHPQGVPQSASSNNVPIPQSHVGHFQAVPTVPGHQHWQNQQAVSDISQNRNQNKYQPSQADQNLLRPNAHYSYELSPERKIVHPDHLNAHINQQQVSDPVINRSSEEVQVPESNGKQYQVPQEPQGTSNSNSSFHATLGFEPQENKNELQAQNQTIMSAINQPQEQLLTSGQQWLASTVVVSAAASHSVGSNNVAECNEKAVKFSESASTTTQAPSGMVLGKVAEPTLLDERSLLACIVRAIPAGADGRIRISTTLPNRLGKMLAPLHWHDYKKHYGKLDDFVAHHPELFVIEGDYIHLCEGAQEIISATAAVAKVAAAAASSASYASMFPSVALTPVAQSSRQKGTPSADSKTLNAVSFSEGIAIINPGDPCDGRLPAKTNTQQPNGVSFNIVKGLSDVNISTKSKNAQEVNGLSSEMRPAHSSVVHSAGGNGANRGLSNGRLSFGGKQQGRSNGAGIISRR